ncbi:MAG: hypothetical protein U7123_00130 [Potamolinea sp.]
MHWRSAIAQTINSEKLTESSDTIEDMGKAGKALRQVLETYGISQNKLAVIMGTPRSIVFNVSRKSPPSKQAGCIEP